MPDTTLGTVDTAVNKTAKNPSSWSYAETLVTHPTGTGALEQEKRTKEDEGGKGAEGMGGRKGCNCKASFWKCLKELRVNNWDKKVPGKRNTNSKGLGQVCLVFLMTFHSVCKAQLKCHLLRESVFDSYKSELLIPLTLCLYLLGAPRTVETLFSNIYKSNC